MKSVSGYRADVFVVPDHTVQVQVQDARPHTQTPVR